jgi:hypothetical protein
VSLGGVTLLDLPSVRGNPFDNRPIEASRAQDLVGRKKTLHRWRDHIHSGSPRMILLVGDSGSGRTSMINAISSQTPKKYIGQYLSEGDNQVRTVLHEILTHFGTFQSIPTMNQLSQKLVSIFDDEKGPLPLIALDYPSQAIDINVFLPRISPILSRLRAMIIVSLTQSQFLDLDEGLKQMFDEPDRTSNFTKNEIQEMVNNRMRLKSKEKWNINSEILESIHFSTGGNPRDVIRILKRLVDEKRDLGCYGTLENLMSGRIQSLSGVVQRDIYEPPGIEKTEILTTIISDQEETEHSTDKIDDFIDVEPPDMWDDDEESQNWSKDFSIGDDDWSDEESLEIEEVEIIETTVNDNHEVPTSNPDDVEETELSMENGTEPPVNAGTRGPFGGLRARLAKTSSNMKNDNISDVPITYADNFPPQSTLDKFVPEEKYEQPEVPISDLTNVNSEALVNHNVESRNYHEVISTEGSEWSVEPSFSSTLPDISIKSAFGLSDIPPYEESQSSEPLFIDDPLFDNPENPMEIITPMPVPTAPLNIAPRAQSILNFSNYSPKWDPDQPLDNERFYSLSDAERLILQIAATREISPSDNELQARLEVGRPRLSQLYNGLQKSGLLSVRKQGRTRLFKLSNAAAEEF